MHTKSGCVKTDFGHCWWAIKDEYTHIYNLFVHDEHRGKGHAREMLRQAVDDIRKAGYMGEICIVANPKDDFVDRKRLTSFYESMGLEVYTYYG